MKNKKVFLIINSYYIGDILLVNPLIQNIKRVYKDSWVVMLTPPSMVDVAKYQEGVDDVIEWDRHGIHRGWYNMFKFVLNFPYKNIYAAFPIYSGDRAITLAWLLKSKYIIGERKNIVGIFVNNKYKIDFDKLNNVQESNVALLGGLTKEKLINYPIKLSLPNVNTDIISNLKNLNENYVVICPTSSNKIKDMPEEDVCEIIKQLPYKVVLLGKGDRANNLSDKLSKINYTNLIDLTNKTSFMEFAKIIEMSSFCISVDTGSLHLACGLNKKTIGVFYNKQNWGYKPDSKIYPNMFCDSDLTSNEIIDRLIKNMQCKTL